MTQRQNTLRCYRFQGPEWIPCHVGVPYGMWQHHDPEEVESVLLQHPVLFPEYRKGSYPRSSDNLPRWLRADTDYTDPWGRVWRTVSDGIIGAVVHHPLQDWDAMEEFDPPDPDCTDGRSRVDWRDRRKEAEDKRRKGNLVVLRLLHGHTFLTLTDLRGYQDLILDMADEDPRLDRLIAMILDFNLKTVARILELDPDVVGFPEDLGMQRGPMLSPDQFRDYIAPVYRKIMQPVRKEQAIVHMHSDGDIMDLADDLLACGVQVLAIQDLVNGIDNMAEHIKGRVAIDLDIDRQNVTVHGTPKDIDNHIRHAVERLGSVSGGLSLHYGCYAPTPVKNLDAVCTAMEKYSGMST